MTTIDFAVFIITHGRADKVVTYSTIRKQGYTGPIFLIVDNEDKQIDEYRSAYGDQVVVFDKKRIADMTDEGDNFDNRRTTTHARNATFEIAANLGVKYWMVLDDDYNIFTYRIYDENRSKGFVTGGWAIKNLDRVFKSLVDFYKKVPALSVAMAQGGDFIGGSEGAFAQNPTLKRKCMNSFICSNERPFMFFSRLNEDVNTYIRLGSTGDLFFTVPLVSLDQAQTQSVPGGMSDSYLDSGTYVKSFYSVMYMPSSVRVSIMGRSNKRLHHKISWNHTVPKILSEDIRKP